MLKILVFLLVVPYFTFANQENIDRLNKKLYQTLQELRDLSKDKHQSNVRYHFLCGKVEAYYEELKEEEKCIHKKI